MCWLNDCSCYLGFLLCWEFFALISLTVLKPSHVQNVIFFSAKSALRQKTLFNSLVSGVKWTKSCMTGSSCKWVPVQIYLTTVNWFEGSTRCATRFPFIPHRKSIKCILSGNHPREADVICFLRFWQKTIFWSFRQEFRVCSISQETPRIMAGHSVCGICFE